MTSYSHRLITGLSVDAILLAPFVVLANVFDSVLLGLLGFIVRLAIDRFDRVSRSAESWMGRVPTVARITIIVGVACGLGRIAWLAYRTTHG